MSFYKLKAGDIVNYIDTKGALRKVKFIKNKHLVKSLRHKEPCLQQQFEDERGCIMHIPVNVWALLPNPHSVFIKKGG